MHQEILKEKLIEEEVAILSSDKVQQIAELGVVVAEVCQAVQQKEDKYYH